LLRFFQIPLGCYAIIFCAAINSINPQIPINGFCKYENFVVDSNYQNILPLNFNGDSYTDLLLYNQSNKIIVYQGNIDNKFSKARTNSFRIEFSVIKPVNKKTVSNQFAFISRKDRRIGFLEIAASGYCRITSELKLDSYPENLGVADINRDGVDELLVSGGSFDGLSVFYISGKKLVEKKIYNKRLFSHSVFTELNNDIYPDIATVDLLENKLVFLYNNSAGGYYEVRTFMFDSKITFLNSFDFNLDGYQDIVLTSKNRIEILLGDPFSKFEKKVTTSTYYQPNKLVTADFNNDGLIDIAYLSKSSSIVSVLYSDENKKFYPEISYLQKNNLSDISLFFSRFVNGVLAYSQSGKLHLIDQLRRITDSTNLVFGINPSSLKYFDAGNDRIYDLCYFDKEKETLNLVVRNSSGIPAKLYRIKIENVWKNLVVDEYSSNKKTFYCYSDNNRLIEIIKVNFEQNTIEKEKIYSAGPITDLRLSRVKGEERPRIYILSNKNNNLALSIFYYKDFRYVASNSNVLAKNVWDAKLSLEDQISVFYWTNENNAVVLNKAIVNNDLKVQQIIFNYKVASTDVKSIAMIVGDLFNRNKNDAISFLNGSGSKQAVVTTGTNNYKLTLSGKISKLNLNDETLLNQFEMRFNGLNKLFSVSEDSKTLNRIEILNRKRLLIGTELFEAKNIQSYFIKNLNFKNYHLVYIDGAENCITIKEIS